MSYRTSIYNNNHTQIQKIFSRGGLRDNSVYQGKSEAYFWTFWTPPLDLCMIMIFCQFQCEFNAWHEKKFHILQCMYVYIHITHVQMELDWAPPPKMYLYTYFFNRQTFLLIDQHTLSTGADVQESRGETDAPGGTEPLVVWVHGVVQEHLWGDSIPHQINALQGHWFLIQSIYRSTT